MYRLPLYLSEGKIIGGVYFRSRPILWKVRRIGTVNFQVIIHIYWMDKPLLCIVPAVRGVTKLFSDIVQSQS